MLILSLINGQNWKPTAALHIWKQYVQTLSQQNNIFLRHIDKHLDGIRWNLFLRKQRLNHGTLPGIVALRSQHYGKHGNTTEGPFGLSLEINLYHAICVAEEEIKALMPNGKYCLKHQPDVRAICE